MVNKLLKELGIETVNPGACSGPHNWSPLGAGEMLESYNPATGELIAKVNLCSAADYEKVIIEAEKAFQTW